MATQVVTRKLLCPVVMSIFPSRASDLFSTICDAELDTTIEEIQRLYPNSGYRLIHGHLQARGLHVQSKSTTLTFLSCSYENMLYGHMV